MRDYDYRPNDKDDRIQRIKDRRALIYRMEEEAALRRKSELSIGASDDAFEQHADAVANKVVSGEDASGLVKNQPSSDNSLQTKSESDTPEITDQFQSSLNSSKGGGQNLDAVTQNEIGSKMGTDLSDVKIHTDSTAHEMSESINAKAFTHGQDIYFKQGNYDTSSTEGKSLLAHELTHTVQQKGGVKRRIQRFEGIEHKKMGDEGSGNQKVILSPYLTVTVGDLTALAGDYFESVDQLKKIAGVQGKNKAIVGSVDEINYILDYHINNQDQDDKIKNQYDEQVRTAADGRAQNLLPSNWSHFSNPLVGDEKQNFKQKSNLKDQKNRILNNETGYHQNHESAINLAYSAGQASGTLDEAWIFEGFSSHYLTDAFSAGHVRTPRKSVADYWKNKIPMFSENIKGWLVEYIVKGTSALNTASTGNVRYGIIMDSVEDKFTDFSFGDLIGGVLHDYDNENGLDVMISGKQHTLYGDAQIIDKSGNKILKGTETFDLATSAIKASIEDINKAFDLGKTNPKMKLSEAKKQIMNKDGLYSAEAMWPAPIEKQTDLKRQQMNWQVESFSALMMVPGMLEAVRKYCDQKIGKSIENIKKDLSGIEKSIATPGLNTILKKFRGTTSDVQSTLQEIIDYTPGAIADTSGWFGAAGDDRAVEYYQKVKNLGALTTLTLVQRKRLVRDGLEGPTVGTDDIMVSGVITSAPTDDIRPSFTSLDTGDQTGWDWIFSDLSGDDLSSVINYAGPTYWKGASFNEKWKECYSLIGVTNMEFPGSISLGPMAELTIMTILRSDEEGTVNGRLNADFLFKRVLDDKYGDEIDTLVVPH